MSHPDVKARQSQLADVHIRKYKPDPFGIKVLKLHEDATIPTRSNKTDAGWDLYAVEDTLIRGGERRAIKTGISLEIPDNYVGLVWPRSGLAAKKGIDVLAGVIDSGYRGEIIVCLYNTNHALPLFKDDVIDVNIKKGDRMAQILFHELPNFEMFEVSKLSEASRGNNGFGSSGQ